MPTRILIVDDDPTIRMLLRRLLERQPGWQVCGDASNGAEAIEKVEQLESRSCGHGSQHADHDGTAGWS